MAWNTSTFYEVLTIYFIMFQISLADETPNRPEFEENLMNTHDELIKIDQPKRQSSLLRLITDSLKITRNVFGEIINTTLTNNNACIACAAALKYFLSGSRLHWSRDDLKQISALACGLFAIQNKRTCEQIIELNIDTFLYIYHEKGDLTEQKICSIILQQQGCFKDYRSKWSVYIPPYNSSGSIRTAQIQTRNNFHKVLHLTDLHVDLLYEPGANAVCDEPVCCHKDQTSTSDPEQAAGKWGDYRNCDMPYHSFMNLLDQIVKQNETLNPGLSYVYFTGDVISHRVWDTSIAKNTQEIREIYKLFKDTFGTTPVFPILGNHEPHPANLFATPLVTNQNVSTKWVYDLVAEEWAVWLPEKTQSTIRYGGYYTVVVKPGFRIIALNSNICYTYNWWLLYEDNDPFRQLHWLVTILAEAEVENEVVHILSHIPPGDADCLHEWTRQYQIIIQRFSNIITGQFNGHTHRDEFRVFYNESDLSQPINVAYNGGSFTSFSNLNPNYKIYDVDSETFEVLDFQEWIYDISEASAAGNATPNWYKLYSFRDAYEVQSLKAKDMGDLVYRMANNGSLLQLYNRYKVREAKPSMLKGCDDQCLKETLCNIVTTVVDDKTLCDNLSSIFNA